MGRSRLNPKHSKNNNLDKEMIAKLYIGFHQKIILPKDFADFSQDKKTNIIEEYIKQIDKVKPVGWEINNIHIRLDDGKVERLI